MAAEANLHIPVLTDAVGRSERAAGRDTGTANLEDREILIAELQTQIAAGAFALTDEIMRAAFAEMEASIFEQISGRLRRELPELIDSLLRERLGVNTDY